MAISSIPKVLSLTRESKVFSQHEAERKSWENLPGLSKIGSPLEIGSLMHVPIRYYLATLVQTLNLQ